MINRNRKENLSYNIFYRGHGLREQAIELEHCVNSKNIESPKMPHSESIAVMKSMDKIRKQIGLKFNYEIQNNCTRNKILQLCIT